jgi:hypothetical protein
MKSLRSRPFILFVLVFTSITFFKIPDLLYAQSQDKLKLSAGTVVALSIENSANSEATFGAVVNFHVIRDVTVNEKVVIKAGALATGTISEVSSSGALGKGGKVAVKLNSVQAVDGQSVYLSGSLDKEGENKVVLTVILGLICLPLLLINGGDANIPAGTEIRAYVEQDYQISVK